MTRLSCLAASLVIAGLAGCAAEVEKLAAERPEIVVATAGPLSGTFAEFGGQMRNGARQAVADINATGGVLGEQLVLELGDDRCDPGRARSVARDLVSEGAVFVAGHFCSSSSIPASEVYANANVVQISPASTNPAFTDHAASRGWTNVLRTAGRDDAQGVVAGEFLAETYRGKNVAIVHDGSTYGKLTAESTTRAMNAGGVREVMSETIGQGDKDFSTLISALKSAKVDAVYLGTYHTEGALIIRQARAAGLGAQFIGADAFVTSEFWSIAGDAGEGMLMTFAPDPRRHEAARDVVARFRAQGIDPEGYTLYTYAAFEVWAEAVRRAGTTDAANVAAALRQNTYTTVLGDLRFDAKGDVIDPAYVFYRWSTGRYSEVPAS